MFTTLFWIKVIIAPVMVLSVSYLQRRFGDRFGGWLIGLPITTGPFILVIGIQEGVSFAGHTVRGILLGQIALIVFCWAYAFASLRAPWHLAIFIGTVACLSTGYLVTQVKVSPWVSTPVLILTWLVAMKWWPHSGLPEQKITPPRWELPVRILVTLALLVGLSALAPHVGAKVAGALSTYPVIASVLGSFNHRRFGPTATASTLRGLMQTLPFTMAIIFVLGLVLR
ncbi:MAG: hypothetical protein WCP71_05290 [Actinomycetes bacterium]|jgi:hypothetical protein